MTSEAPERPLEAPQTNGNGETDQQVVALKRKLFERVGGDAPKAGMLWRQALANFGLPPAGPVPVDLLEVVGNYLDHLTVEPSEQQALPT